MCCDNKTPRDNARWQGRCGKEQNRGFYYLTQLISLLEKLLGIPGKDMNYICLPVTRSVNSKLANLRKLPNKNQL
jgi:hypothetical protein